MRGMALYFFSGKCGRHLQEAARKPRCQPLKLRPVERRRHIRAERGAVGVVGIGGEAEPESRIVALAAAGIKLRETRGSAEEQYENAGRQRIERAEMADLAEAEQAAHGVDSIVRGSSARLVQHQRAVNRGRPRCAHRFIV